MLKLFLAAGGQAPRLCELQPVVPDVWKFFFVVHDDFVNDRMPVLGGMPPTPIAAIVVLI